MSLSLLSQMSVNVGEMANDGENEAKKAQPSQLLVEGEILQGREGTEELEEGEEGIGNFLMRVKGGEEDRNTMERRTGEERRGGRGGARMERDLRRLREGALEEKVGLINEELEGGLSEGKVVGGFEELGEEHLISSGTGW